MGSNPVSFDYLTVRYHLRILYPQRDFSVSIIQDEFTKQPLMEKTIEGLCDIMVDINYFSGYQCCDTLIKI